MAEGIARITGEPPALAERRIARTREGRYQVDQVVSLGADRIGHALVLGVSPDVLVRARGLSPAERTAFIARQGQVIQWRCR